MRPESFFSSSSSSSPPSLLGTGLVEGFESPSALFFLSSLFLQSTGEGVGGGGGGMDFSKVGEKILSSVRSARSLGIHQSQRPEVPARAAAAAAVARAIAGLPPHQRLNLPSSSEALVSIYGSRPPGQAPVEDLEEDFYMEEFDPMKHVLENIPSEGNDLTYFEGKATLRLAQLDRIAERLSHHVMEHHEEMVKGMQLVRELEQDLKVANVICMNGRRHLTSSMHEVSGDLIVHSNAKKKQALVDVLPILSELRRALDMQLELDILVEEGNYFKAFQVLSEYLQLLEVFSGLSAIQEISRGVETWLTRTLQKLDSLLLGVCQTFRDENYLTAVDAYAIIGDSAGLAEKIQCFFMQEVLSGTHSVLKEILQEDLGQDLLRNRFTYSDLCAKIPEPKFRRCLLRTLDIMFKLMSSYYSIMSFQPEESETEFPSPGSTVELLSGSESLDANHAIDVGEPLLIEGENDVSATSANFSPFHQLRKDTIAFVSRTLERGKKNLWQLTTSRVSVLLSSPSGCSTSTHQFLRNYEDLNVFVLAGEAFCGTEAIEFRQRLKSVCESYIACFHRQNIHALKMVLEKEMWMKIPVDAMQVLSLAGLVGDGAPLIAATSSSATISVLHSKKTAVEAGLQKNGFGQWLKIENPFLSKIACPREPLDVSNMPNRSIDSSPDNRSVNNVFHNGSLSEELGNRRQLIKSTSALDDENEDLLADFIDEDSQLPSRIQKSANTVAGSHWNDEEVHAQTGSSLCLLRLMDKYARLMQKLEIVNVEFFKGICQLFGMFFHFIFETFGQRDIGPIGKVSSDSPSYRLKLALSKITQDCDQWIRQQSLPCSPTSPVPISGSFSQMEVTPTIPVNTMFGHAPSTMFGLKERCAAAEAILFITRVLHQSRGHLQSMLSQSKVGIIEDFFDNLVDSIPDLTEYIHRVTARQLLHINGYTDRIASAKWEVKELGLEHNGYVDLLLGEFKHYKTRLTHGGIPKENPVDSDIEKLYNMLLLKVQDLLLVYGLENVTETLVEGLSRVKRCTDEGRALMSLDLQVLINGLQHFVTINVRPKFQVVETFIKAYYLPETEYIHWGRSHPEYSKTQIINLVNLVANMKSWKRKTRLEVLERIEAGISICTSDLAKKI